MGIYYIGTCNKICSSRADPVKVISILEEFLGGGSIFASSEYKWSYIVVNEYICVDGYSQLVDSWDVRL